MLSNILNISLKNRFLVLFLSLILIITGIYLLREMEIDVFPDLTAPTVTVITEAHGLEAVEVERLVTYYLETAINGSPGVRRLRSSSMTGVSIVWVEFEWGIDIYRARQIVSERLPLASAKLPKEVGKPLLAPISSIMGEIMLIGLQSDSISPMEVRVLADWEIVPRIKSVSGVAHVIAIGGEFKQYQVLADPLKMKHYNVSLKELQIAVANTNQNGSGGFLNQYGNQYLIKAQGKVRNLDDIRNGTVKEKGVGLIRVKDIAEVKIDIADKIGDASLNIQPAVVLVIFKQPHTNTLILTTEISELVTNLEKILPTNLEINSNIFQQADFINSSINNLQRTLLEGAFFVSIVLFIFLMDWRTTIISLLAIPLSLLMSIIVLYNLGFTINTMSLGGMAIAIGALVDDAIIDVENVFKRLRENAHKPKNEQIPMLKVVYEASIEIRSSIIIATIIIIVSFIPLFFLSGIEGRLLQPLGISFIISLAASLLVAITVTPVLSSYLLGQEKVLKDKKQGSWLEKKLRMSYRNTLPFLLNRAWLIVSLTAIGFGYCIYLASGLGRSFLPEFNEGSLVISAIAKPGISLEESNKIGKQIEALLLEMPEIETVSRRTGRAESDEHAQGVNASEIDAPFTLKDETKEYFYDRVREKLSPLPGVNIVLGQPIAHRIDHMLSGSRANIAVKIFGSDLSKLYTIGKDIKSFTESIPGFVDVVLEQQVEVPQIRIIPNLIMLAKYGLTKADLAQTFETAIKGEVVSQIYEGQKYFDLIVRYNPVFRDDLDKLGNVLISTNDDQYISISKVAEIQSVSTPVTLNREGISRKVVLSGNVSGRDLRGVVKDIQKAVEANVVVPQGYRVEYGGQFESEESASQILVITSIMALLVIFILLYFEFKELTLAAIVLINLPLALMGGILTIQFTSGIISIAATIGFISLFGIATRNGILLISKYQAIESDTLDLKKQIIEGSDDRLIPILMTAITTALALFPIVMAGNEAGNEIQAPMALVILGGLLSATFLNLVIIPSVYLIIKRKVSGKRILNT